MTGSERIWCFGSIAAALLFVATAPEAGAQAPSVAGPPAQRLPTFPPVEEPVKITCKGDYDAVWVDPKSEGRRATYKTFAAAMCGVKSGGTVYVHPHPRQETVRVAKPNLRFRPATGGSAYLAAPAAAEGASGACFIVEAGGRTIVSNFVFEQGSDVCVDVRRGGLTLVDTLVLGAEGDKASIRVSGLGSLDFRGARPADFGVCLKDATKNQCRVTNTPSGVGVDAATGSRLALAGVTFADLSVGVRSSATTNDISDVTFRDNKAGAIITDAAIGAEAPPALSISGGAFERNEDGLRLVGSPSGAFRGRVTIEPSRSGARLAFNYNRAAIEVASPLVQPLAVDNVDFVGNTEYAIKLPVPDGADAQFNNVNFDGNATAISLVGDLDGELRLLDSAKCDGDAIVAGRSRLTNNGKTGIAIPGGRGKFEAYLSEVSGAEPAFRLDNGFVDAGRVEIVVLYEPARRFISVSKESEFCRMKLGDEAQREMFRMRLDRVRVTVLRSCRAGSLDQSWLGDPWKLDAKGLRRAQKTLCR